MTKTTETIKLELSQLSIRDRAELAHFLIHSLDEDIDDNIKKDWDGELNQRLGEILQGTAKGDLADQVLLELREKYS